MKAKERKTNQTKATAKTKPTSHKPTKQKMRIIEFDGTVDEFKSLIESDKQFAELPLYKKLITLFQKVDFIEKTLKERGIFATK